jgi:kinesin family protein 18/19
MSRKTSVSSDTPPVAEDEEHGAAVEHGAVEHSMFVAVRVRPLWRSEREEGHESIARTMDKVVVIMDPAYGKDNQDYLRVNRTREKSFAFDFVADETVPQETLYNSTTQRLVETVLQGCNGSSFAYGATGAGKTFTMLGTEADPGIFVHTVNDLYKRIRGNTSNVYRVSLSYLEVYNENIRDLLSPSSPPLDLREDPIKGVCVAGITECATSSAKEIMRLLVRGNMNRTVEPTSKNETSSRSHAVLQIVVEQQRRSAEIASAIKVGKLCLIDLAGSERATVTDNRGARLVEGANINRSLLALANCINALAARRMTHVPYRDSKLTRLLKDTFGGNCRTVMIANIAPTSNQFEETTNTLKYAHRARTIKTKVSATIRNVDSHISEYKRVIRELQLEVCVLKEQLGSGTRDYKLPKVVESHSEKDETAALVGEINGAFEEAQRLHVRAIELEEGLQNSRLDLALKSAELKRVSAAAVDEDEARACSEARELLLELRTAIQQKSELLHLIHQRLAQSDDTCTLIEQRLGAHCSRLAPPEATALGLQLQNRKLQLENVSLVRRMAMRERLAARVFEQRNVHPSYSCAGTGLALATSAPGPGSPLPHLHRDWAHPCHICAGIRLFLSTSAPEMSAFAGAREGVS